MKKVLLALGIFTFAVFGLVSHGQSFEQAGHGETFVSPNGHGETF